MGQVLGPSGPRDTALPTRAAAQTKDPTWLVPLEGSLRESGMGMERGT